MEFALYDFPFGHLKIGYKEEVLFCLKTVDETEEDGQRTVFTDRVYDQVMEYLKGERTSFDLAYEPEGTAFQKRVWQELTRIPYGETRSYKEIAAAIGNPKASRAVGMANNKNPLLLIVPCHRVVGADGRLVGYAGGLAMKEHLLNLERAKTGGKHGV